MSELLPAAQALHAQTSPVTLSEVLKGKSNTLVFDPLRSSALRWYMDNSTSVEISGPFLLSLKTPSAPDKTYSVSIGVIPDKYRTDHPKGEQAVGDLPGAASIELTGLSPPVATPLSWHHTIDWKVQPIIRTTGAPYLPLFVIFFDSLGTSDSSTATFRIHCNVSVSGSNFPKTW